VGGGVSHGPTGEQNFELKMSLEMKRAAMRCALSLQAKNIIVCDDMNQLDGKTAPAQKMLNNLLPEAAHILVVMTGSEQLPLRSLRNIPSVYVTQADRLNVYEVAYADAIVFTKESVKKLEERLEKKNKSKISNPKSQEAETETKPAKKAAKPAAAAKAKPSATADKAAKKVAKPVTKKEKGASKA
jgi:hypothetical protein